MDTIIDNLTAINFIEAVDEVGYSCFTCTRRAYESDFMTAVCGNIDVFDNICSLNISKGNIFNLNIALYRYISEAV